MQQATSRTDEPECEPRGARALLAVMSEPPRMKRRK